jgi:hypothetical protein
MGLHILLVSFLHYTGYMEGVKARVVKKNQHSAFCLFFEGVLWYFEA